MPWQLALRDSSKQIDTLGVFLPSFTDYSTCLWKGIHASSDKRAVRRGVRFGGGYNPVPRADIWTRASRKCLQVPSPSRRSPQQGCLVNCQLKSRLYLGGRCRDSVRTKVRMQATPTMAPYRGDMRCRPISGGCTPISRLREP